MTDGLKDAHREAIIATLAANDRVERAVLFGSRATGTNTMSSDVDIALFGERLTLTDRARLAVALDEIPMAQSVDLLLYDSVQDLTLREHIRRQGVEWYARTTRDRGCNASPHFGCPGDWALINLGLACTKIGSGATPRGGKEVYLPSGPYSLIRSQNVLNDRFGHDGLAYIGEQHASELAGVEVQAGDVLLNITGDSVARACQVDPDVLPARVNQHVAIIRPDPTTLDPSFLRYFLVCPDTQTRLLSWAGSGGTRNALTKGMIEAFDVSAPRDVAEQRTIANILGTLDDKIELNRRMNATLGAMARGLFRSWFVDFNPVRAKMEGRDTGLPKEIADLFPDRLVDSELGEIPEGWQLRPLDAVARFQNGLALQKFRPSPNAARLPVVKIAQLRCGEANSGEWASATITPECIIEDGDVVFSWSGSLLVRTWCGGRAALNQHLFRVTSEEYPKWYYLHSILSHFPEFQRIAADKATTMGHIRRHHLSDALCVVPPDRVIAQVTGLLGGLVERQVANDVASRTLTALRDALLPQLVSGELRVDGLEPATGSVDNPAPVGTHGA